MNIVDTNAVTTTQETSMKRRQLSEATRTKTVATIGPASSSPERLKQLIETGVDVFRLNMAHGSRPDHEAAIQKIRAAGDELQMPVGILVDLAGPKIRLGKLADDPLKLKKGKTVRFCAWNRVV